VVEGKFSVGLRTDEDRQVISPASSARRHQLGRLTSLRDHVPPRSELPFLYRNPLCEPWPEQRGLAGVALHADDFEKAESAAVAEFAPPGTARFRLLGSRGFEHFEFETRSILIL
jgi:hypothetical protein